MKLPANIIGWLDGRSSLARLGLMVHVTAHRIDPGWEGKIVLEFYNSGKLPLALRPNMVIGALSFEVLSGEAKRPYSSRKDAKYKNQQSAVASRIDEDKGIIDEKVRTYRRDRRFGDLFFYIFNFTACKVLLMNNWHNKTLPFSQSIYHYFLPHFPLKI